MLTGPVKRLVRRGCGRGPVSIIVVVSPVREERDESIGGLVAGRWPLVDRRDAFEGAAFEFQVGVQVGLCGLDRRVAEPERDARGIDPSVQERHRAGVPQGVRGDVRVNAGRILTPSCRAGSRTRRNTLLRNDSEDRDGTTG